MAITVTAVLKEVLDLVTGVWGNGCIRFTAMSKGELE